MNNAFKIKSISDSSFSFKSQRLSKDDLIPFLFLFIFGSISFVYLIASMKWMMLSAFFLVFGALLKFKINHDKNHRSDAYSEYLSKFKDVDLHHFLSVSDGADKKTIEAIRSYLGIKENK